MSEVSETHMPYKLYKKKLFFLLQSLGHTLVIPFFWGRGRIETFNKGRIWMHLGVTQSKQCRFIYSNPKEPAVERFRLYIMWSHPRYFNTKVNVRNPVK